MGAYPPPPYGNDWKQQQRLQKQQAQAYARAQRDAARAQREAFRNQRLGMRRSSIVGPLLLITIGVCFLLVQIGYLPAQRLWEWYARFWPLLLVGTGVLMLLEWAFDHYVQSDPDQPRYRRRLGGGVFTLLLILSLVGVVFSSMHQGGNNLFIHGMNINQDNLDEFLGDKHESDQTVMQALPAGAGITIDNPRGDIIVSGISDDNQIHISAHKQVFTRSDSEASNKAQRLTPTFNTNGNTVAISLPALDGARADLTITLPASTPTTVTANHGDIRASNLKAPVSVTANHGDIDLSAITGPIAARINNNDSSVSIRSATGPISIAGHGHDTTLADLSGPISVDGDFFGTTHFQHIRGPIKFHTSRTDLQLARLDGELDIDPDISISEAAGPLTLTTGNRNITLDRIAGDISVTNRNGSVDLTSAPPLGNVTIQNRSGSVDLTLPKQADFTLHAEAANGDVDNDFSLPTSGDDNRKIITGTVGKGGPNLRITTEHGDIDIKKASVMPLPPRPPAPPPLSIRDSDGSSVIINKDGVNIASGPDGSSVIVGKDGTRISSTADGTKVYTGKDGTRLNTTADGTTTFQGKDGTHFVSTADGTKSYSGSDGTRITITADGSKVGIGPNNKVLTDAQIDQRIRQAEAEVRSAIQQRDAQSKQH